MLLKHGHYWKLIQRTGGLSYDEPKANTWHPLVWICYERVSRHPLIATVHKWSYKSEETLSLWPRQAYGSGCSCPPSPTSLSHVMTGLRTVWHLEETTRSAAKILSGAWSKCLRLQNHSKEADTTLLRKDVHYDTLLSLIHDSHLPSTPLRNMSSHLVCHSQTVTCRQSALSSQPNYQHSDTTNDNDREKVLRYLTVLRTTSSVGTSQRVRVDEPP